jgi:hypothetical protein
MRVTVRAGPYVRLARLLDATPSHEAVRHRLIHDHQLHRHEPRRDIVAELGPYPLGWAEYRGQGLDKNDNADGAGRDGVGPEWFDKAYLTLGAEQE